MDDDIVARLRAVSDFGGTRLDGLWTEAAAKIERLQDELHEIRNEAVSGLDRDASAKEIVARVCSMVAAALKEADPDALATVEALRNAVIEECAKVVEEHTPFNFGLIYAEAIRALKGGGDE